MKKSYRLTITFTCRINETVKGICDIDGFEHTRKFLETVLEDDEFLLDIYKLQLYNGCLEHLEDRDLLIKLLKIKDLPDIFIPAAKKMPRETTQYIEKLYAEEPTDKEAWDVWEKRKILLEDQFGPLTVQGTSIEEIDK